MTTNPLRSVNGQFSIVLPLTESAGHIPTAAHAPSGAASQLVIVCEEGSRRGGNSTDLSFDQRLPVPGLSFAEAVNLGIENSDGQFVCWLHPGDSHADDALPAVEEFFGKHPDVDVVYGDAAMLDEQGNLLGMLRTKDWRRSRIRRSCCLNASAVFMRRRVVDRHGLLDPRWRFWPDYDFWLRLDQAGVRFARLPKLLGASRVRGIPNWLGADPRERTAAGVAELSELFVARLGQVPTRWLIHYGLVAAWEEAQRQAPASRFSFASAWKHAAAAHRQWNNGPGALARRCVWLPLRFAVKSCQSFLRHASTRPALPAFASKFIQQYLKRRIFQLRHHDPRPLAIPASYRKTRPPQIAPAISIVTPNLNQGRFLEATLRSVLDQDYPNLEFVVQDGGSTDESVSILHRYSAQLTSWSSERDSGQADAVNRGMRHTSGEILAYLNSDDLLLPGTLAYVAQYFVDHPQVDIVYGHRVLIDESGDEIGRWVLPAHDDSVIPLADYIPQETMFWRRRAWNRVGARLDDSFQFAMDWELILRLRSAGLRFARLPRFLGAFRVSDAQKTQTLLATVGRREMDACRQKALGRLPTPRDIRRATRHYLRRQWWLDKLYLAGLVRY
jgi:GT2 family glycosyltransferase